MTIEPWMVICAVVFFMAASFHLGVKFGADIGFKSAIDRHSNLAAELLLDVLKEMSPDDRPLMRDAARRVHERTIKGVTDAIQKRSAAP